MLAVGERGGSTCVARLVERCFAPPARFLVLAKPVLVVRSAPVHDAEYVTHKLPGDLVLCERGDGHDGWLRLVGEEGWVHTLSAASTATASSSPAATLRRIADGATLHDVWALQAAYPMVIVAFDGLCNRLRTVLSFALVARARRRPLTVVWPLSPEAAFGRFTDAFEPLDGVEFVDERPSYGGAKYYCHPTPSACDFHDEVKGTADEDACYALLRPNDAVRTAVRAVVQRAERAAPSGRFVSVHVRRTDHWGSAVTDDEFAAFVRRHVADGSHAFIATDNLETQRHFVRQFGASAHVASDLSAADTTSLRQTTLAAAVVDIYCAAAASGPFKGTPTSSYSDTILRLRRIQGHVHPDDEHECTDAEMQYRVSLQTAGGHRSHSARGMARDTYERHELTSYERHELAPA
jgi:hypothetical protein